MQFSGAAVVAQEISKPKTPMLAVKRYVTVPSNDATYSDSKQQYEKLIKGMEIRFKKKGKYMSNMREVEKVIPRR